MEKRGRPSKFSARLARIICERLAEGMTLREVCRADDMPAESTVRQWVTENYGATDTEPGFYAQYTKAREIGYQAMADELLEIADNGTNDWMERSGADAEGWAVNGEHVQRSRLRLDTRKWLLSKALPKIYGDKVAIGGDSEMDPIKTNEIGGAAKLAAVLAQIAERSGTTGSTDAE